MVSKGVPLLVFEICARETEREREKVRDHEGSGVKRRIGIASTRERK